MWEQPISPKTKTLKHTESSGLAHYLGPKMITPLAEEFQGKFYNKQGSHSTWKLLKPEKCRNNQKTCLYGLENVTIAFTFVPILFPFPSCISYILACAFYYMLRPMAKKWKFHILEIKSNLRQLERHSFLAHSDI